MNTFENDWGYNQDTKDQVERDNQAFIKARKILSGLVKKRQRVRNQKPLDLPTESTQETEPVIDQIKAQNNITDLVTVLTDTFGDLNSSDPLSISQNILEEVYTKAREIVNRYSRDSSLSRLLTFKDMRGQDLERPDIAANVLAHFLDYILIKPSSPNFFQLLANIDLNIFRRWVTTITVERDGEQVLKYPNYPSRTPIIESIEVFLTELKSIHILETTLNRSSPSDIRQIRTINFSETISESVKEIIENLRHGQ